MTLGSIGDSCLCVWNMGRAAAVRRVRSKGHCSGTEEGSLNFTNETCPYAGERVLIKAYYFSERKLVRREN